MFTRFGRHRGLGVVGVLAAATLVLAACGSDDDPSSADGDNTPAAAAEITALRLGFFPNVTHAPAMVGMQGGFFKETLDPLGIKVSPTVFNAGPEAVTAFFGGSLDISYVGPNPTINAYVQSQGDAVRVISGAASAGASLVVSPDITSPEDLAGKTLVTPQLGNTQDVALRYWLKQQGYVTDLDEGGDVSVKPLSNSEGLAAFTAGEVDGAWVPEPWATLYQAEGAKVLVDERDLWPDGKFVTTDIVVRTEFLEQYPDVVKAFLEGHLAALEFMKKDPAAAQEAVNTNLTALTGSPVDPKVLSDAWKNLEFTADPLIDTLKESAAHAIDVELLDGDEVEAAGPLDDMYDLTILNGILKKQGLPEVGA
jgi:NitT/TauT family transport system substrate-binding protein